MQYMLFPERPGAMRIPTQASSGVVFMAICCRVYLNLFLDLTEEGIGLLFGPGAAIV
jgi:hypothetical protein